MREKKLNYCKVFVNELFNEVSTGDTYKSSYLKDIAKKSDSSLSDAQISDMISTLWGLEGTVKVGRGEYEIPEVSVFENFLSGSKVKKTKTVKTPTPKPKSETPVKQLTEDSYVPAVDANYVRWGDYRTIDSVIKSKMFYPIFITGLSGNGKTMMVEQACAKNKRDMYRVNITCRTDEDDLLGGFRLVDGQTVWFDGPVVKAMKSGAVLLLDEIDLASDDIMCLQPILEGKGVFLKKINKFVEPSAGFQVFATANTKGQGDEHGKFVGTGFLNEAFLERFPVTVEQSYPKKAVETKILTKFWNSLGTDASEEVSTLIDHLVAWANITRTSYNESVLNDLITTRRLVFIMKAYSIFGNVQKSVELNLNRFDSLTKMSFIDLFKKVSAIEFAETDNTEESEDSE
tara:strand:- start:8219 stop:9424 length:1206 start_codon:yes stop_codon:yes gene_type:complete